jgi:hypothetical protein
LSCPHQKKAFYPQLVNSRQQTAFNYSNFPFYHFFIKTNFCMRSVLTMLLALLAGTTLMAQQNRWQAISGQPDNSLFAGRFQPAAYKLFSLAQSGMMSDLRMAPSEKNVSAHESPFVVTLPGADGTMEAFRVVDAPVMEPALAARYPDIHSYIGVGVNNPLARARFSMSPQGFQGMITEPGASTTYISQLNNGYMVYRRSDAAERPDRFECFTKDIAKEGLSSPAGSATARNADDATLRTYRLALCAGGEYSQFWLDGTETSDAQRKSKVLAAMNNQITRLNGIYERDFSVRLVLIANNDAVIYLNASTDPFTTSSSWNSQTQTTCTNVIGSANYDVGHLVMRAANNGNAGCIGCVCTAGSKGSGWTAYQDLASDFFVVDYLTHEIGHQFGGNHTHTYQSSSEGSGVQVEPGSGSTIMGYAGITGATTDVQPHSDDYFHSKNIEQITNYIKSTSGGCAVTAATGNSIPTASAGADYVIPRSTPFTLSGTGSDANAGDVLTYCWEQTDSRATGFSTVPSATATAGPQFRSYLPVTDGSRTFPRLASILDGTNANKWEVIPSVARTLNFRFTVRDNRAGGAGNRSDDMVLTINGSAGPFAVSAPNTAVTWAANSAQTITWSVNGTNAAPINCANVKISLSTDGGNTFPTVLVASTPNDGTESIVMPNTPSSTCRVKIEAVGNIFFDISNVNFTIGAAAACGDATGLASSSITNTSATVSWNAVSGANSYDIDYKTTASSTWTNAATGTTGTSVSITGLTQGTAYDWRVRANCTAGSGNYVQAQFTTTAPCGTPTGLASSSITSSGATVSWTAVSGANNYTVEYKTTAATSWTTAASAATTTSVAISGLSASTAYDWRVRANCASGSSAFAQAQFTTAAASTCPGTFDVSTNGTASGAATIPFNTDIKGLINTTTDNDYYRFVITTGGTATITLSTLPADFDIRLYSSNGTTQLAISQAGGTTSETISRTYTAGTYFVRVYGYNGANSTTQCYTLRVQLGTATREADVITSASNKQTVELFPNPARTQVNLYVSGYEGRTQVQVFDLFGKQVMQQVVTDGQNDLDIKALPQGIYMMKVLNNNSEVKVMKFVKE